MGQTRSPVPPWLFWLVAVPSWGVHDSYPPPAPAVGSIDWQRATTRGLDQVREYGHERPAVLSPATLDHCSGSHNLADQCTFTSENHSSLAQSRDRKPRERSSHRLTRFPVPQTATAWSTQGVPRVTLFTPHARHCASKHSGNSFDLEMPNWASSRCACVIRSLDPVSHRVRHRAALREARSSATTRSLATFPAVAAALPREKRPTWSGDHGAAVAKHPGWGIGGKRRPPGGSPWSHGWPHPSRAIRAAPHSPSAAATAAFPRARRGRSLRAAAAESWGHLSLELEPRRGGRGPRWPPAAPM